MWSYVETFPRRVTGAVLCVAVLAGLIALSGCSSGGRRGGVSGGPEIVEGGVIFHYFDRDAKRVYVVGDFNNWAIKADPMVDENGDGQWTLFLTISPGAYEYKFVIDGAKWIADPRNPDSAPDGFNSRNSVLKIPNLKS